MRCPTGPDARPAVPVHTRTLPPVPVGDHLGGIRQFLLLLHLRGSRDAFGIPHDLKILKEVFGVDDGDYRRSNEFWTCYSIRDLVESEPEPLRTQLREQDQRIRDVYAGLSATYQDSKGDNDIPFN